MPHQGNREKWKHALTKHGRWNSRRARHIQRQEAAVIIDWLKRLDLPTYNILEIGCGNGYVGQLIIESLTREGVTVTYTFTDLLPECLNITKNNTANLPQTADVKYELVDVYQARRSLGESSQDIIISTGFASAATYEAAVPVVAKLLKAEGVLICDFVNHLAPALLLRHLPQSAKNLAQIIRSGRAASSYHFGIIGIDRFFKTHNLRKTASQTVSWRQNPLLCMFKKEY